MKKVTPVVRRTRTSTESYEVCPHCDQEIGEKSTYVDEENYVYHRPCMASGPIDIIKPAKLEWGPEGIKVVGSLRRRASYADQKWAYDLKHAIKSADLAASILETHKDKPDMAGNLHIRKNLLPIFRRVIDDTMLRESFKLTSGGAFESNKAAVAEAVTKTEQYLAVPRPENAVAAAQAMRDAARVLASIPKIAWGGGLKRFAQEEEDNEQEEAHHGEFVPITIPLSNRDEVALFTSVVNQGIDASLQAFTKSKFSRGRGRFGEGRLVLEFHTSELPMLVRRLEELGTEESERWAEDIKELPEYSEALTHADDTPEAASKPVEPARPVMIPEATDDEIDAIIGDDETTAKFSGWLAKAAQMDDQGFFEVPKEFLIGRPDVDWMKIRHARGVIEVTLTGKTFRDVHKVFDGSDWNKGWHNGVKRMLDLSMPQDHAFDDWVARTFGVTKDNPTGKVMVPEASDDEIDDVINKQENTIMSNAAPRIVKMANGKFGLKIARSDFGKVFKATPDGKVALSKKAVVELAAQANQPTGPVSIFDFVDHWKDGGYGIALVDANTDVVVSPYVDPSDYPSLALTSMNNGAKSTDGKYYIMFHSGSLEDRDYLNKPRKKDPGEATGSMWAGSKAGRP